MGLYENRIKELNRFSVSDIINRGSTFLGSARFPEFRDSEKVRAQAIDNMKKHNIDALVVIGGDGSYRGAKRITEAGFLVSVYLERLIMMLLVLIIRLVISPLWIPLLRQLIVYVIPQLPINVFR